MAGVTAACLMLVLSAVAVSAQTASSVPPIDTDRPDVTDGTATVPLRHLQFETGFTHTSARDRATTITAPELLVRYGLFDAVELRVSETYQSTAAAGSGASLRGLGDVTIGTKFHLTSQHRMQPALSGEAFTSVPIGADAVSARRALPGAALLLGWNSDGPWSAGIEFEAVRGAEVPAQGVASLSVQLQATNRLQPYVEYYTLQPFGNGEDAGGEHYANAGVLLLLRSDVQLDGRIGVGLNHTADRSFIGFGFSVRR
jgi:hypothetical protein